MIDACEYCERDDVILYAWHADTWCANCIRVHSSLPMFGELADAPIGRPENPDWAQPFVWQTPDRRAVAGVVRGCPSGQTCDWSCDQHKDVRVWLRDQMQAALDAEVDKAMEEHLRKLFGEAAG